MKTNKDIIFDKATDQLVSKINLFGLDKQENIKLQKLVLLFRHSFKLRSIKLVVYNKITNQELKKFPSHSYGLCKASTYAFYNVSGGNDNWDIMYISFDNFYSPHYYLMHKKSQNIFDLTFDQFSDTEIPYNSGKIMDYEENVTDLANRFLNTMKIDVYRGK